MNGLYEPDTPIKHRFSDFLNRDKKLVPDRIDQYGLHPLCKRCVTDCEHPQYDAPNVLLFRCLDFKE